MWPAWDRPSCGRRGKDRRSPRAPPAFTTCPGPASRGTPAPARGHHGRRSRRASCQRAHGGQRRVVMPPIIACGDLDKGGLAAPGSPCPVPAADPITSPHRRCDPIPMPSPPSPCHREVHPPPQGTQKPPWYTQGAGAYPTRGGLEMHRRATPQRRCQRIRPRPVPGKLARRLPT
jgi:hypothetical protein